MNEPANFLIRRAVLTGLAVAGLFANTVATACDRHSDGKSMAVWDGAKAGWYAERELNAEELSSLEGMRAYVDPTTNQLRQPTASEAKAMSAKRMPRGKKPRPIRIRRSSNGILSVVLNSDYLDATTATLNADGTVSLGCVRGLDKADQNVAASSGQILPQAEEK